MSRTKSGSEYSRYSFPLDTERALLEGLPVRGAQRFAVLVFHPSFIEADEMTEEQARTLAIRQAALRIACGMEQRSLRTLARQLGCSHHAIDKALRVICERIGVRKYLASDETRQKQSEAHLRGRRQALSA